MSTTPRQFDPENPERPGHPEPTERGAHRADAGGASPTGSPDPHRRRSHAERAEHFSVADLRAQHSGVRGLVSRPWVSRLLACLALGFVLALAVGPQEGTRDDYSYAFRASVLNPRIFAFLAIGLLVFVLVTFKDRVTPYLNRSGVRPLAVSAVGVVASLVLLRWTDSGLVSDGKFGTLAPLAAQTPELAPMARVFFTPGLVWGLLLVAFLAIALAIITGRRVLAWVGAGVALVGGLWAYLAHNLVESLLGTADHSTGSAVCLIGFLAIAVTGAFVARERGVDTPHRTGFVNGILSWRPGFVLAVLATVAGLESFVQATWFAPSTRNATYVQTIPLFTGEGLAPMAMAYLQYVGLGLFVVGALLGLLAALRQQRSLGIVAAVLGVVGVVYTLMTLYLLSSLAADKEVDNASGAWQNLGAGGWLAALSFTLILGAGVVVYGSGSGLFVRGAVPGTVLRDSGGSGLVNARGKQLAIGFLVLAVVLFVPPTMTDFWQKVLVTEIGVYVLLAIGLNVVVGWAGLLDLGFIAFYAIGSYVTAYLVGSLPVKPPEWLHLSPLWAIPFAIVACLAAGVLLGAPTLRLRGDYLAIVTMGFGEIIRIAAINLEGITNSTRGPSPAVPHPVVELGPFRWEWGLNNLQYWYLLVVITGIVLLLFNRLEHSRIGRAWAAIREDEVAAQATGINTVRFKLLAFAIGASTSGITGVFFASQVGYFNPDNFLLNNSFLVVAYVVFGGMGSLPGAMAGAAVLTWLPEFLKDQVPADDRQMWIGVVVLLMMIFRPAGLIPARRRKVELHGLDPAPRTEPTAVPASEGL